MSGLDVMAAAAEVEAFCKGQRWGFCFIGGVAVQRWGAPRFTQDVDLTLMTGFGGEARFIDAILGKFAGRLRNAREFALQRRVLLAKTSAGIALDVALGAFPFEEASIARATHWAVGDHISLTTCSAEDLIIHKIFAGRDRDLSDAQSVLARQYGALDFDLINKELPPLLELKEDCDSMAKFLRMVAEVEAANGK